MRPHHRTEQSVADGEAIDAGSDGFDCASEVLARDHRVAMLPQADEPSVDHGLVEPVDGAGLGLDQYLAFGACRVG